MGDQKFFYGGWYLKYHDIVKLIAISVLFLLSLPVNTYALFGIQCTDPSEYQFGQITSVSSPSTAKMNSWVTISLTAKNTGDCRTMYRAYAEVPADFFPQYSFPDYFWLDPGESKTVSMQLYTGGQKGSPTLKIKLESHYTAITYEVDSRLKAMKIGEESPTIEEQIQQTQVAIESEIVEEVDKSQDLINSALSEAEKNYINAPISKIANAHYALHLVGRDSAIEDLNVAKEAQQKEISISENFADTIAITIGYSFTPFAGLGEAVVTTVCAYKSFKNTPLADIRNSVTQSLIKNDIVYDDYLEEEKYSYVTVYVGGPVANPKMVPINKKMKDMGLPYFEGNSLKAPGGKEYGWGYGVYALLPDINPGSIRQDGTVNLNLNFLTDKMERGEMRLYSVVAAGTDRKGTEAAGSAYLETLEIADEMSEIVRSGLCLGELTKADLYLIQDVLSGHIQSHSLVALEHPECLNFGLEFTQSLILLGNSDANKEVKVKPMAMIVKKTGNSWTPVGVYYGG